LAIKILHFADLHLGVETYGRPNPKTGLSSRIEDYLRSLDQLIKYAIDNKVDVIIFCGDTYKNREPTPTQQRELAKRINLLSKSGISLFLLPGNHDIPNTFGRANSVEVFDTLDIENVFTVTRPEMVVIQTASGPLQIAALPWLRRSSLLAHFNRETTHNLSFSEINRLMEEILTGIVSDLATKVDQTIPAILAAHIWVSGAKLGTEANITIGYEHTLLPSILSNPAFDYVALGHIHRQQVIGDNPPLVYSGSLDRIDFGDELIQKGFYVVDIENDSPDRKVSYKFVPLDVRDFKSIEISVENANPDPTTTIVSTINKKHVTDAIVKLMIKLPSNFDGHIDDHLLKKALAPAHYYTISRRVQTTNRTRVPVVNVEKIGPTEALRKWIDIKKNSGDINDKHAKKLLLYGKELISLANEERKE
jgi:exonuclease SbcD